MADSYGSKAKPVALDPFQNIVEVHWKKKLDTATHVAFSIILQADGTDTAFHSEAAPDSGTSPAPDGYFGGEYYASTALRYYSGSLSVGEPTQSPWARVGGEWFSAISGVSVEGMPVNEVSPYWFDRVTLGEDERAASTDIDPSWNWIDPTGDEIAIPVPGFPLINFKAGGAGVEMNGPYYTGGKFAFDGGLGSPVWLYERAGPSDRFLENFPPPLTIAFLGNHYSVIGAKVVPSLISTVIRQPRVGGDPTSPGLLWVLAERITA